MLLLSTETRELFPSQRPLIAPSQVPPSPSIPPEPPNTTPSSGSCEASRISSRQSVSTPSAVSEAPLPPVLSKEPEVGSEEGPSRRRLDPNFSSRRRSWPLESTRDKGKEVQHHNKRGQTNDSTTGAQNNRPEADTFMFLYRVHIRYSAVGCFPRTNASRVAPGSRRWLGRDCRIYHG